MTAAVTISPASGSVVHALTAANIRCSGLPSNNASAYDSAIYPSEPQLTYYFKLAATGQDSLRSQVFSPSEDGIGEWNSVIVPAAGSWTLTINKVSDDSVAATAAVTVS